MKDFCTRMILLVAVVVPSSVPAYAAVVTVTPEHTQGWGIVTNQGATADVVAYGPAVYEREKAFVADDGQDLGKGAYYATIGFEAGTTPPSAWLPPWLRQRDVNLAHMNKIRDLPRNCCLVSGRGQCSKDRRMRAPVAVSPNQVMAIVLGMPCLNCAKRTVNDWKNAGLLWTR
jgi:hypothetical protein